MKSKPRKKERTPSRQRLGKTTTRTNTYQRAAESRTAVAAKVAWMLALMATVLAELLGLACQLMMVLGERVEVLRVFAMVMLFVALLAGLITLALIPVVLYVAEKRPPRPIVVFAMGAGSLPLIAIFLQQIAR